MRPSTSGYRLDLAQLLAATIFFLPCVEGRILTTDPALDVFDWYWLPQMLVPRGS